MGLLYSGGVYSVPPFLWAGSPGYQRLRGHSRLSWTPSVPDWCYLASAQHHFQTLDFLAHGFVEDGVG